MSIPHTGLKTFSYKYAGANKDWNPFIEALIATSTWGVRWGSNLNLEITSLSVCQVARATREAKSGMSRK